MKEHMPIIFDNITVTGQIFHNLDFIKRKLVVTGLIDFDLFDSIFLIFIGKLIDIPKGAHSDQILLEFFLHVYAINMIFMRVKINAD